MKISAIEWCKSNLINTAENLQTHTYKLNHTLPTHFEICINAEVKALINVKVKYMLMR